MIEHKMENQKKISNCIFLIDGTMRTDDAELWFVNISMTFLVLDDGEMNKQLFALR